MTDPLAIWKEEATEFNPAKEGEVLYRNTDDIERYLKIGTDDSYHYLIGPKGVGKSMLIRQKAYLYLQESGIKNVSGNQLTENVNFNTQLSIKDAINYRDIGTWTEIWIFSIYTTILRHLDVTLPRQLQQLLGKSRRLSEILTRVIQFRADLDKYTRHNTKLSELISENVQSGIVLCIDSIDAGFVNILRNTEKLHFTDEELPTPVKVWVNCQNGAVAAAHTVNDQEAHLKILVTLRTEAFNHFDHHLKANYKAKAVVLDFDKTELRRMFEQKIRLMPAKFLSRAKHKDPIVRLVGFETMSHPYAGTGRNKHQQERVFDFFYRHTFGRPRELATIGMQVSKRVKEDSFINKGIEDKMDDVRYLVHNTSGELLDNYLREIIPRFDDLQLKMFLKSVQKNVFTRSDVQEEYSHLLKYYYNLGLIGRIKSIITTGQTSLIQEFLPVAKYGFVGQQEIPEGKYFLTHPCLDHLFYDIFGTENYYNRFNIIGQGLLFEEPPSDDFTDNDWIPKEVSGGRLQKSTAKNSRPLREYYLAMRTDKYLQARHKLQDFDHIFRERLTKVFRLIILRTISLDNTLPEFDEELQKCKDDLKRTHIRQAHTARLGEVEDILTIPMFYERLQTRLLVIACILYSELSHPLIKDLVANLDFDFAAFQPENSSPENYLRNAFFIYNFTKTSSPYSLKRLQACKIMWHALSTVEQKLLIKAKDYLLSDLPVFTSLPKTVRSDWENKYNKVNLDF